MSQVAGGGSSTFSFAATLDYYVMPDTYYNTLIKGLAHDVPVITGNAKDENGATFGINLTMSEYLSSLNETFGEDWAQSSSMRSQQIVPRMRERPTARNGLSDPL